MLAGEPALCSPLEGGSLPRGICAKELFLETLSYSICLDLVQREEAVRTLKSPGLCFAAARLQERGPDSQRVTASPHPASPGRLPRHSPIPRGFLRPCFPPMNPTSRFLSLQWVMPLSVPQTAWYLATPSRLVLFENA